MQLSKAHSYYITLKLCFFQRAKSKEQRAKSKEQRAKSKEFFFCSCSFPSFTQGLAISKTKVFLKLHH